MPAPYQHQPVLWREVLEQLGEAAKGRVIDGTVGGGGHAVGIMKAGAPTGWLYGFDRDGAALEAARGRLAEFEGRFELFHDNFAAMDPRVPAGSVHGVLLDLGVSSHQLDTAERGFSFQQDGPLDMRMDARSGTTAADIVNDWNEADLARLFWEWGEERQGRRLARAIAVARRQERLDRTGQLAQLIERCAPRYGGKRHPATRVFQALRMAVNDETHSLECGLAAACSRLAPGGRLVVITFHSIEDRLVKQFGRDQTRDYEAGDAADRPELRRPRPPRMRWIVKRPVTPSDEEIASNPRARSAKMRVLERI